MKILVTFAVESEFRPWRRLRAFQSMAGGQPVIYEVDIGRSRVVAALSGVGPRNAARAARRLLVNPPDVCVCAGLAGGLKPEYGAGGLLVARAVTSAAGGPPLGSDPGLVELAAGCGARVVELFQTSDRVVLRAQEKSLMGAAADAVEMESFPIMREAAAHGVPAVSIRAISDPVDMDLPIDFCQALDEQGAVSMRRVLARVGSQPRSLPPLLRLSFVSARAAAALARFLDGYVETLAGRFESFRRLSHLEAG